MLMGCSASCWMGKSSGTSVECMAVSRAFSASMRREALGGVQTGLLGREMVVGLDGITVAMMMIFALLSVFCWRNLYGLLCM